METLPRKPHQTEPRTGRARLNTEYLRYFVAVAEELHFGRAAARLSMAQQPLSRQIRRLEEEVGVKLFERTTRRVALTPAGGVFLEETRKTLDALDRAVEEARRAERGEVGTLRVGYTTTALYGALPEVVRSFRGRFPGVRLELAEMGSAEIEEAILAGGLQAAVLYGPVGGTGVESLVLRDEPMVAVLPEGHPLAGRDAVALRELAGEPFVFCPRRRGPGLYDQIVGFCREAGFSPNVAQEAAQEHTVVGLVASGVGVALGFECMGKMGNPGVVFRPLADAGMSVELCLLWRTDDPSPALRAFVDLARGASVTA